MSREHVLVQAEGARRQSHLTTSLRGLRCVHTAHCEQAVSLKRLACVYVGMFMHVLEVACVGDGT